MESKRNPLWRAGLAYFIILSMDMALMATARTALGRLFVLGTLWILFTGVSAPIVLFFSAASTIREEGVNRRRLICGALLGGIAFMLLSFFAAMVYLVDATGGA